MLVAACGSTSTAARIPTPSPTLSPSTQAAPSLAAATSPTTGTGSRSPLPTPSPAPAVSCRSGTTIGALVMMGSWSSPLSLIYEVSDPTHPRLVCRITNSSAHLFTADTFEYLKPGPPGETDMVLHSMGSGNESVAARFPFDQVYGSWLTDGSEMAYTVQVMTPDGFYSTQVWLYAQGRDGLLYTFTDGIGDCICRFGLPAMQLALSPDGGYLVAGWIAGKGSQPLAIYRVSDRARVFTLDQNVPSVFWNRTGHQLFMDGLFSNVMQTWTPEGGASTLPGHAWSYEPGLSPDAGMGAYTAYLNQTDQVQWRVFVYDLKTQSARVLIDQLRTSVMFVKDGWVWYAEEKACTPTDSCAGGTEPTGNTFAMQLSTGAEQSVAFASGDSPGDQSTSIGLFGLAADYWPSY